MQAVLQIKHSTIFGRTRLGDGWASSQLTPRTSHRCHNETAHPRQNAALPVAIRTQSGRMAQRRLASSGAICLGNTEIRCFLMKFLAIMVQPYNFRILIDS
jgi:hypothetical protein